MSRFALSYHVRARSSKGVSGASCHAGATGAGGGLTRPGAGGGGGGGGGGGSNWDSSPARSWGFMAVDTIPAAAPVTAPTVATTAPAVELTTDPIAERLRASSSACCFFARACLSDHVSFFGTPDDFCGT